MGKIKGILLNIRIFSRRTPDGKVECVKLRMETGAVTGTTIAVRCVLRTLVSLSLSVMVVIHEQEQIDLVQWLICAVKAAAVWQHLSHL